MKTKKPTNYDTILYRVRAGDSLSRIIQRYHGSVTTQQRNAIISQIQADNPAITNPNRIFINQMLQISIPPQYISTSANPGATPTLNINKQVIKPLQQLLQRATPQQKSLLSALTPVMLGAGAAGLTMVKQTFIANAPLLTEMVQNYEAYKAGDLSKGQYDYRRKSILAKLKSRLGPLIRALNAARMQSEVLRISRTRGRAPTQNITRQIGRMDRLAKYASRGGVALSVVGLGIACNDIANTNDMQEKNEILVESVGGLAGGALFGLGAGVAILMMATPVGWAAALVIGVGGAVAGYAAGKASKVLYTTEFSRFDVASMTRVAHLCKK